jgi:hypothetical protein
MAMLTGNTGDVKPQLLSFSCTESAADTATSVAQSLPVLRNFSPGGGSRAQLIEVLKVWFIWGQTGATTSTRQACLSTKNKLVAAANQADPDVFAFSFNGTRFTTSGEIVADLVSCVDLTDGDGNGVLVATDNIYLQVSSTATGAVQTVAVKMLYRISGASVIEYVGIVQGQQ